MVDPALLVDAQTRGGVDAELRVRLRDRLHEAAIGAGIVVCTCSTISGAAELREIVCADAWADFEAGHMDAYLDAIARAVDTVAAPVDVIVLAQASMAAIADRARTPVPILSSPRLAVAAAIAELPTE